MTLAPSNILQGQTSFTLTKPVCDICGETGIARHGGWWCPRDRQWNRFYRFGPEKGKYKEDR